MTLAVEIDDLAKSPSGTPLDTVWLHGFTQTCRSWAPLLSTPALSTRPGRRFRVDLPGHGASPVAMGDLEHTAHAVMDTVIEHGFDHGVLVGYSLGGRTALHAALGRPSLWRGVVLIGATPGLQDAVARRQRLSDDERLAESLEGDGVDRFLERWLAQPLFATFPTRPDDVADRLRNTAAGLASSLRWCGTGTQQDLRPRLGELMMPALILAGARDTKFVAAGRELAQGWGGDATFLEVPDAGHAAHLERPEMTADIIGRWLTELS